MVSIQKYSSFHYMTFLKIIIIGPIAYQAVFKFLSLVFSLLWDIKGLFYLSIFFSLTLLELSSTVFLNFHYSGPKFAQAISFTYC